MEPTAENDPRLQNLGVRLSLLSLLGPHAKAIHRLRRFSQNKKDGSRLSAKKIRRLEDRTGSRKGGPQITLRRLHGLGINGGQAFLIVVIGVSRKGTKNGKMETDCTD